MKQLLGNRTTGLPETNPVGLVYLLHRSSWQHPVRSLGEGARRTHPSRPSTAAWLRPPRSNPSVAVPKSRCTGRQSKPSRGKAQQSKAEQSKQSKAKLRPIRGPLPEQRATPSLQECSPRTGRRPKTHRRYTICGPARGPTKHFGRRRDRSWPCDPAISTSQRDP